MNSEVPGQVHQNAASPDVRFPRAPQGYGQYTAPPAKTEDGEVQTRTVQTIQADAQTLYAFWRDVERFPLWQEFVVSVEAAPEPELSHWVMGDPADKDGKRLRFTSRITEDVPGERIAWASVTEGVEQSGSVTFHQLPHDRGTRVTLHQQGKLPGGLLGNAVAALVARSPRQTVIENLRHCKQMVESGEIPSVRNNPHGPRGISGGLKEWMYGERNPTPPGSQQSA